MTNKRKSRAESAREYAEREMPVLKHGGEKDEYRRPWVRQWLADAHLAGAQAERKRAARRAAKGDQ